MLNTVIKKFPVLFLMLALSGAALAQSAAAVSPAVQLGIHYGPRRDTMISGVVVGDGTLVLTQASALKNAKEIVIALSNGDVIEGKVERLFPGANIGLIRSEQKITSPARLLDHFPPGVVAARLTGCPQSFHVETISVRLTPIEGKQAWQIAPDPPAAFSGAAVMSASGSLVGVAVREAGGTFIVVPATQLEELIAGTREGTRAVAREAAPDAKAPGGKEPEAAPGGEQKPAGEQSETSKAEAPPEPAPDKEDAKKSKTEAPAEGAPEQAVTEAKKAETPSEPAPDTSVPETSKTPAPPEPAQEKAATEASKVQPPESGHDKPAATADESAKSNGERPGESPATQGPDRPAPEKEPPAAPRPSVTPAEPPALEQSAATASAPVQIEKEPVAAPVANPEPSSKQTTEAAPAAQVANTPETAGQAVAPPGAPPAGAVAATASARISNGPADAASAPSISSVLEQWKERIAVEPRKLEWRIGYAGALQSVRRPGDAAAVLERALADFPNAPIVYWYLGLAYMAQAMTGRNMTIRCSQFPVACGKSLLAFEDFVRLAPDDPHAGDASQRIQTLRKLGFHRK